jgi:hypothetical protein
VGVYRRPWNYAERNARRFVLLSPQSSIITNFSAASIAFNALAWDITGIALQGQGTASNAPIRRVGVYRKRWNYAERNAIVDIIWVEQAAGTTVTFSKPALSLNARAWTVTNASPVSFTTAHLSLVSQQWIVGTAPTVNFTRATISFSSKVFSLALTPGVELSRATLAFNSRQWVLSGAGNVIPIGNSPATFTLASLPFAINPGEGTVEVLTTHIVFVPRQWLVTTIQPEYALVSVQAYRNGHYGGLYRFEGDIFNVTSPFEYSPYWMTLLSTPPSSWIPFMPTYTPATDLRIYKPLRTEDIDQWVDEGIR